MTYCNHPEARFLLQGAQGSSHPSSLHIFGKRGLNLAGPDIDPNSGALGISSIESRRW